MPSIKLVLYKYIHIYTIVIKCVDFYNYMCSNAFESDHRHSAHYTQQFRRVFFVGFIIISIIKLFNLYNRYNWFRYSSESYIPSIHTCIGCGFPSIVIYIRITHVPVFHIVRFSLRCSLFEDMDSYWQPTSINYSIIEYMIRVGFHRSDLSDRD